MNRITPERALAAYEAKGLRPMQFIWTDRINDQRCACGLSAVYAHEYGAYNRLDSCDDKVQLLHMATGLPVSYLRGFINGFDNEFCGAGWMVGSFKLGYTDGKACWAAVKHLVPANE